VLEFLCFITLGLWSVFLRSQSTVIYTARNADGRVLTLSFHRNRINPMGTVVGQISSGGRVVSEMLLVDDEINPVPPRVEVMQVAWIKDSDLLGRCVINTKSKEQSQRFVISYMNIVPGEFAHYPPTPISSRLKPAGLDRIRRQASNHGEPARFAPAPSAAPAPNRADSNVRPVGRL
jgi:hypothetical protein